MLEDELVKEARRLGFDDPDKALRSRWKDIPRKLRDDLIKLGFEPHCQKRKT